MSMIGKALAHYIITGQLGKGGMGEVFRAKDRKLGRDVAIKVLPVEFARDTDRVARFQREAKLLASLNHPNIAAIHGLEESGGTQFLVLELVEGETLAEQLKRGPIPVEDSLKLALQIAEALEAAHERGVIHRDLKPANIKVTPEGRVKVLDFGLAKAFAGEREQMDLSNSPTLSEAATMQGVILGTAAYMSPEQAKGKAVDKRADTWAFGAVLFEMLTGRQMFTGETASETLASVIKSEPEWKNLPPHLHPRIRLLLERCLKKDPRDRYSGISDARVDIQEVLSNPGGVLAQPVPAVESRTGLRKVLPWVAAALVLGAVIAGAVFWKLRAPESRQIIRFDYELPEGLEFSEDWPIDISPDGKKIVYSTSKGLYLRSVDELTSKLISGTDEFAIEPFFSPDGKWIGYFSYDDWKLKKISVNGGAPATLCSMPGVGMGKASWGADDWIVYSAYPNEIMRIRSGGGTPEALVKSPDPLIAPQILPDGKSLMYTTYKAGGTHPRIMVKPLKSGEPKEILAGYLTGYLPTGHIVYWLSEGAALTAAPFDADKLEVVGDPVPMVEGASYGAVSTSGTLVYISRTPAAAEPGVTLVWVNREGKEEALGTPQNTYAFPIISPDGTRVALSIGSFPDLDVWIWDIGRKTLSKLTFEKTRDMTPIWSPDGKRIAYWGDTGGTSPNGIYLKASDGTGEAGKLISTPDPRQLHLFSWSRDGKALLMQEMVTWTNMDLCMLSMEGDRVKKMLLGTEYAEVQPKISPDGRWLAYSSNETTGAQLKTEVYVRPFPDANKGKWQVSTGGGNSPLWSPDGRELFYLGEGNSVMSVSVETSPALRFGTPRMLFKSPYLGLTATSGHPWDIHPDGKRFLMMKPQDAASKEKGPRPKMVVVTNWFEELKQRAPAK